MLGSVNCEHRHVSSGALSALTGVPSDYWHCNACHARFKPAAHSDMLERLIIMANEQTKRATERVQILEAALMERAGSAKSRWDAAVEACNVKHKTGGWDDYQICDACGVDAIAAALRANKDGE